MDLPGSGRAHRVTADKTAPVADPVTRCEPRISVVMPSFNQAAFLLRALDSLLAQQEARWEAIIIDDGSTDATPELIRPYLDDPRFFYERLDRNRGLGFALNQGLCRAVAPYVAYLPSDDLYYPEHLSSLLAALDGPDEVVLAYAGVRHTYDQFAEGQIAGYPLQLVQVAHRRTEDRWLERDELVTDDLDRLFWAKLRPQGNFTPTGIVSCEWVFHKQQMHRWIRESKGGINPFRLRYQVSHPMRFHSTEGELIDEVARYQPLQDRPAPVPATDGLKILLVGELAYNPERILALEERGHRLYGLWTTDGWWFNTVGPLPFGHVTDLPRDNWEAAIHELRPDIIYALLNWQAVPFAHQVLQRTTGIPFVWHFKEGPFACLEHGIWDELVDLLTQSDGQIYASAVMRDWFEISLAGRLDRRRSLVLDGDLPKQEWFTDRRRQRLSEVDGAIHTVVPGRPVGMSPDIVRQLADEGIHLHFYGRYSGFTGSFREGQWESWAAEVRRLAPRYVHFHPTVQQDQWVSEFSQYDAGWLHLFRSKNDGDLHRANWDDMNLPARMSTMAAAGLPLIQRDNSGCTVATEELTRSLGVGLFYQNFTQLRKQLEDRTAMERLRQRMWRKRHAFSFDHHADRLVEFFHQIIKTSTRDGAGQRAR
jgi:hypothetical protein